MGFYPIFCYSDNDSFRAKRRTLLDDLKSDVKRLMEEAATKNSLPENSCLVLSFCGEFLYLNFISYHYSLTKVLV